MLAEREEGMRSPLLQLENQFPIRRPPLLNAAAGTRQPNSPVHLAVLDLLPAPAISEQPDRCNATATCKANVVSSKAKTSPS